MKELNLKSQKGITLIGLIIIIIILAILASVIIMNFDSGVDIRNYNYMCADIELLKNKILVYYNNNEELPIFDNPISNASSILSGQTNLKDNDNYYQINLEKLSNITLNYGTGNTTDDIYVINEQSHEVYYLKGIEYGGTRYFKPFK